MDGPTISGGVPFRFRSTRVLRDRDRIYGEQFRNRVKSLGIDEVLTAPRSPWQNPYVERIIGSIRRERTCLSTSRVRSHDQLKRQNRERLWQFLMSVVFIMSTGERPDRPAGLLSVSGEESLLVTACVAEWSSMLGKYLYNWTIYIQAETVPPSFVEQALCPELKLSHGLSFW